MRMELYHSRIGEGICPQCGARLPEGWKVQLCEICNNQRKENARLRKVGERYRQEIKEKKVDETLDDMATEAHEKHLTYGQLQAAKIIERLRVEQK